MLMQTVYTIYCFTISFLIQPILSHCRWMRILVVSCWVVSNLMNRFHYFFPNISNHTKRLPSNYIKIFININYQLPPPTSMSTYCSVLSPFSMVVVSVLSLSIKASPYSTCEKKLISIF